ncbi:MAG: HNH endonuclease [Chloroflexi bacterium]|nr:HNH endonuclease [Chloroflexota bacterium]
MVYWGIGIGLGTAIAGVGAYLYYRRRATRPSSDETTSQSEGEIATEVDAAPQAEDVARVPESTGDGGQAQPMICDYSTLPGNAKAKLLYAVWYRCENPYCNHTDFLDVHYILDGGSNKLDNLIVLCPRCHRAAHNEEITEEELQSWITERPERFRTDLDWPYK